MSDFNLGVEEAKPHGTWQADPNGLAEGDGQFSYRSNDGKQRLTVVTYFGQADGKPVLQIDGEADFRINVNDAPVYDRHTDSESVLNLAALALYRQMVGMPHRHTIDIDKLREALTDAGFTPDAGR